MSLKLKKGISLFLRSWVFSILVALLIATSFKSAIADWNIVPSGSMNPTIVEGDRIFVNKLAYDLKIPYTTCHLSIWDNPDRGDIVVFYSPADGKRLVKRVIGIPGDHLEMRENRLFINGEPIHYDHVEHREPDIISNHSCVQHLLYNERLSDSAHLILISPRVRSINSFGPINIPEDHYFMMGDNRDNSFDSRYFGLVERKKIVGQANSVIISLDRNNHFSPRWSRFFTKLS